MPGDTNIILYNFSGPLKAMEIQQIESLAGRTVTIVNNQLELDFDQEILCQIFDQVRVYKDAVMQSAETEVWLHLPQQNSAAVILTVLFTRWLNTTPKILRTRIKTMGWLPYHEVIEIIDLGQIQNLPQK